MGMLEDLTQADGFTEWQNGVPEDGEEEEDQENPGETKWRRRWREEDLRRATGKIE